MEFQFFLRGPLGLCALAARKLLDYKKLKSKTIRQCKSFLYSSCAH